MSTPVKAEWDKFRRGVIDKDTTAVQLQEMQRAFFAGATAMSGIVIKVGDECSEEEGISMLKDIAVELKAFANGLLVHTLRNRETN